MEIVKARKMMGKNIFGIPEYKRYFGISIQEEDSMEYLNFPWTEQNLLEKDIFDENKTVFETHFAFWGIGEYRIGEYEKIVPLKMDLKSLLKRYELAGNKIFCDNSVLSDKCMNKTISWPFNNPMWQMIPIKIDINFWGGVNLINQKNIFLEKYWQVPAIVQVMALILMSKIGIFSGNSKQTWVSIDKLEKKNLAISIFNKSLFLDWVDNREINQDICLAIKRNYFQ